MPRLPVSICACAVLLAVAGCQGIHHQDDRSPIIGTWLVKIPEAPFPLHMFVFHADGTVEQSNPDAGDPNSSDSNLMGVWVPDGDAFKGKIVEITADRATHHLLNRMDIIFRLTVSGNALHGIANATPYDANGRQTKAPIQATLDGERVQP